LQSEYPQPQPSAVSLFEEHLNELNLKYYQECDADVVCIHEQIKNRARYLRVSEHGPKLGDISRE
jgi:glycogen debranching enzyme